MAQQALPLRGRAGVQRPSRGSRLQADRLARRFGLHLIAVLLGIVLMVPFYWAIIGSLKQSTEVRQIPLVWWPAALQWVNYWDVWHVRFFPNWVWNSAFLTAIATTGTVISSSLAGFAFARFQFPGRNLLFTITLATLMLPSYVLLIPNYMLFWQLGWLNTYLQFRSSRNWVYYAAEGR